MDCGAFVRVRCLAVLGLVACLPPFFLFFLFFAFLFISLLLLLSFCPCVSASALLCLSSCLVFPFLLCFVVSFSLSDYMQKEKGAIPCVLSCPVVGLLCKIGFSVLVKLVIIGLNVFCYAFVGVGVFIIVPPLLKKTFENTLNKIPRVKFVLYALLYVV